MAKDTPVLDVQGLTKSFGALLLFRDISFSIAEGQRVGLIAKNGTGKSTLLSSVATFVWECWNRVLSLTQKRVCLMPVSTIKVTQRKC